MGTIIWTALVMGLVGSLHCAAMCGPLMLGLSSKGYQWYDFMIHHAGRWLGYIILALVFRVVFTPIIVMEWQQTLGVISGLIIVLFAMKSYVPPLRILFDKMSNWISWGMGKSMRYKAAPVFLGVLNGLLPCGLSFAAAVITINLHSTLESIIYMLAFGLGTLPVLIGVGLLPQIKRIQWTRFSGRWMPRILLLTGVLIVVRSAGLGIPYISPKVQPQTQEVECCHKPS